MAKFVFKRKVRYDGGKEGSLIITLPMDFCKAHGIKKGDIALIGADKLFGEHTLSFEQPTKEEKP